MEVRFDKALKILEKILEGKPPKVISHELEVNTHQVSYVKHMFPLFTGLPNKYNRKKEEV